MSWPRRLIRIFVLAIITLVTTFACLVGCMVVKQDEMIYMPRSYSSVDERQFERDGLQELSFIQPAGNQTAYWLASRQGNPDPFIWLVFSGNGGCATDYLSLAQAGPATCGWLFVDYPGYGACEGKPNPDSIRTNALGAADALALHLGKTPEDVRSRLGTFGHSIGSAVALDSAVEMDLKQVVLVAPFTTMKDMAANYVTPLFTFLLKHRFDNRATMKEFIGQGGHATIFHGAADNIIPSSMGRELATLGGGAATFIEVKGSGHNDIIARAESEIAEALSPN